MKAIARRPALVKKAPVRRAPARPTQSVNVNVRNIMRTAPDYIIPQRTPGGANRDMGDQIRAFSQPMRYGNSFPVFLPYQDRSAIQGQQLPQVSGPDIERRRDIVEQEVDPADIGGVKPISRLAIPSRPFSAFTMSQSSLPGPSNLVPRFEGVPQPTRIQQLDDSELIVSRQLPSVLSPERLTELQEQILGPTRAAELRERILEPAPKRKVNKKNPPE